MSGVELFEIDFCYEINMRKSLFIIDSSGPITGLPLFAK